jgi:hypothetical protein
MIDEKPQVLKRIRKKWLRRLVEAARERGWLRCVKAPGVPNRGD